MARSLAVTALHFFLFGFVFVLFLAGCARPEPPMDWGALARGVHAQQEQSK